MGHGRPPREGRERGKRKEEVSERSGAYAGGGLVGLKPSPKFWIYHIFDKLVNKNDIKTDFFIFFLRFKPSPNELALPKIKSWVRPWR